MTRDPRISPVAGDVLQYPTSEKRIHIHTVSLSAPHAAEVCYLVDDPPELAKCTLVEWHAWAKPATIIKRGDEP